MYRQHRILLLAAPALLGLVTPGACRHDPTPSVEGVRVDHGFVRSLQHDHLRFAAALASDEWITFEDYQAATLAFIGCASSRGATLRSEPELSKRLRYFYALETPPGRDLKAEVLACRKQYLDPVEFVWARYKPVTAQEVADAEELMTKCLQSASSTSDWQNVPPKPSENKRRECARSVFDRTGLPDYYVWE